MGNGAVAVDPELPFYSYGDEVTLTATADPGWTYAGWSGDVTSADEVITITIEGDAVITATFTPDSYTHDAHPTGNGPVAVDPALPFHCYGDQVKLNATADPGWTLPGWRVAVLSVDEVHTIHHVGHA